MLKRGGTGLAKACALALPVFVLVEVNYPLLTPQSRLALFAALGLALCFLGDRGGEAEKRAPDPIADVAVPRPEIRPVF